MPIYPYRCECGREIEERREMVDRNRLPACTYCGRIMRRVMTCANVIWDSAERRVERRFGVTACGEE